MYIVKQWFDWDGNKPFGYIVHSSYSSSEIKSALESAEELAHETGRRVILDEVRQLWDSENPEGA